MFSDLRFSRMGRRVGLGGIPPSRTGALLAVFGVALAWIVLFYLNSGLLAIFRTSWMISWIFLPAGLRLWAVMQLGWQGVAGLFLGALVTSALIPDVTLGQVIILAAMSSLGYPLGIFMARRVATGVTDWRALDALQLYVFASLCAACSALMHCAYFTYTGVAESFLDNLIPMFIGDLGGVFILIYAVIKPLGRRMKQTGENRLPA